MTDSREELWASVGLGWIDRAFPLLCLALGGVAIVGVVGSAEGEQVGWAVALVALAVLPWALSLGICHLPQLAFGLWVLTPVGVLVIGGESLGIAHLHSGGAQIVLMLAVCVVGQLASIADNRAVVVVTAAAVAILVAASVVHEAPLDMVPWYVGLALGLGGGLAFRANVKYLVEVRAANKALARQAMEDERRRIAREVHDVVAHTMAVTMLHLTAARMAVLRDPAAAVEALEEAERQGRASLDDIRQVVRLLRADEGSATDAAAPRTLDLDALVTSARAAGLEVELTVHGDREALRPATALALYRVVQESLTNAARHGAGPVRIELDLDGDVRLVVTNPVDGHPARPPGAGVSGMRERIEALGGAIEVGPVQGSWRVAATVPAVAR